MTDCPSPTPAPDIRGLALRYLAASAAAKAAQAQLTTAAGLEHTTRGVAPTWRTPDGASVAAVTTGGGPRLVDPAALQAWLARRRPDALETITQIRPKALAALLAELAATGDVCTTDGEVVPGMVWDEPGGFSHVRVTATTPLRQRLAVFATGFAAGDIAFALPAPYQLPEEPTDA